MKITVLMSTYNGEKYIKEQIESILNQSISDLKIIIRDDGSKDNTINILNEYKNKYTNIKIINGENKGAAQSFIELLKYNMKTDFIAFCDQDDIWEKDKLKNAIAKLDKYNDQPALYYSEVKAVDSNLNFLFKSEYKGIDTLGSSFSAIPVIGCTVVFNNKLRNIIVKNNIPEGIVMHDLYLYRVCLAIGGKIIHDKESYILYRQHEENVVGITNSIWKKMKVYNKFDKTRRVMAKNILDIYEQYISKENKQILLKISRFNDNIVFKEKLSFIFDKNFKTKKFKSDIKFIYDVLLKKI